MKNTLTVITLLLATWVLLPLQAGATRRDTVVEEPGGATLVIRANQQGQWFQDMAKQPAVKYVFIGRPGVNQTHRASGLSFVSSSKIDLIEIVSAENASKGRNAVRRLAERIESTHPLELVYQARDEDDSSLITIYVVVKPDDPKICTDVLIYKWSKLFEVALIHLKGEFDISSVVWDTGT